MKILVHVVISKKHFVVISSQLLTRELTKSFRAAIFEGTYGIINLLRSQNFPKN